MEIMRKYAYTRDPLLTVVGRTFCLLYEIKSKGYNKLRLKVYPLRLIKYFNKLGKFVIILRNFLGCTTGP